MASNRGVLITGGLGVIGSWVTKQLVDQGVRAVTYSRHVDTMLVKDVVDKIEMVRGDILDMPMLLRTIKEHKIQRICHLAGTLGEISQTNPWHGFQINAVGTLNVLEAARIMEVERVVFTSSMAVFAPFTGDYAYPKYRLVNEDYPKLPISSRNGVYGTAKLASELLCYHYNQMHWVDYVALRFSPLYGIGRLVRHGRIALFNKMIENAMLGQPTTVLQGGDERTDLLYVKDAANSIVLACFAQKLKDRVFNIGTSEGYKLEDVASAIKKIYPEAVFEIGKGLDPINIGSGYCIFDISRAKAELGYSPRFTLEGGIRDYVETMERLNIEPTYSP